MSGETRTETVVMGIFGPSKAYCWFGPQTQVVLPLVTLKRESYV